MKSKRLELRLDPATEELLESLSSRYHTTKQKIIKQAIIALAGKRKHTIKICFYEDTTNETKEYDKDIEELIKIANTKWVNK